MSNTTFVNGTVIRADWLNDVNALTYGIGLAARGSALLQYIPAGTGAIATNVQSVLRRIVYVDDFCAGDGVTDDRAQFIKAWNQIIALGGGTLVFGVGKTYYLNTNGQSGATICDFNGLSGVTFEMNGSTILTGTANDSVFFLLMRACSKVNIKNGTFQSQYTTLDASNGMLWTYINTGSSNIKFQNMNMISGNLGITGQGFSATRVSRIFAENCYFSKVYYPMNFQGNGDDFHAYNIVARNCGRSYFPWNVKNHEVYVDSQQGGPFDDILLKVYADTNTALPSSLENIKVNYTTTGRFAGSGAQSASNAIVAIEFQQNQASTALAQIRNIDVKLTASCDTTATNANVFTIRKLTSTAAGDATTRGYITRNLKLGGTVTNAQACTNTVGIVRLFSVETISAGTMNWTGENTTQTITRDLEINGSNASQNQLYCNGQANASGQNFLIDNTNGSGNLVQVNMTTGNIAISNSKFANLNRVSSEWLSFTPVITTTGTTGDVSGLTSTAFYIIRDGVLTINGLMSVVDATKVGTSGAYLLSLPIANGTGHNSSNGAFQGIRGGGTLLTGSVKVEATGQTAQFRVNAAADPVGVASYVWTNATDYISWTLSYVL